MDWERFMEGATTTLAALLSYEGTPGYVGPGDLLQIDPASRSAVQQAFEDFGVQAVFGLPGHQDGTAFIPLVYVAEAENDEAAVRAHRSVWTQGTVPFALIATTAGVWSCDGFAPPSEASSKTFVTTADMSAATPKNPPAALGHLTSLNLRVSLARPTVPSVDRARVDAKLLDNLRALAKLITAPADGNLAMPQGVANALIGRLLFIRFLRDRGCLPHDWLPAPPGGSEESPDWVELLWDSLARADEAFNGSAFPVSPTSRASIAPKQAAKAFTVIVNDADLRDGKIQLGFSEFRFASLRTETLSAVYELFLDLADPDQKVEDGAVYTPPFLADHVLQKVARERPFGERDRVLDCAAGSGVFLVGAFRRIVEAALPTGKRTLPLRKLHTIVRRSIWGIERNPDACQVAALSLYLTMLDYADPQDVQGIVSRRPSKRKVFPELVGRNILSRDFFDRAAMPVGFPSKFEFVLANPPWIKLADAGDAATKYASQQATLFTDANRAAPAFLHKALSEHMVRDGAFGFVMSARALVSSAANHFPSYLATQTGLSACSNLSNLRRSLFLNAEHPAVVLIGHPTRDKAPETFSVFHPNQLTQPLARDGRHWVLVEDRAERREYRRGLIREAGDLIEALTLHPADHRFQSWIVATRRARSLATLADAIETNCLTFSRGGTPGETGVPAEFILNATKGSDRYYLRALGRENDLVGYGSYELPETVLARANKRYRETFSGNVVLFARNASEAMFVRPPIAFNSSFYGISAPTGSTVDTNYLQDLAAYLCSEFARYCFSVIGRDWAMDERRLEREQIMKLPIPSRLASGGSAREPRRLSQDMKTIAEELRLPAFVAPLASEFTSYRQLLQNSRRPAEATANVTEAQRVIYEEALTAELGRYLPTSSEYAVRSGLRPEAGIGVVNARHLSGPVGRNDRAIALAAMEREINPVADRFVSSSVNLVSGSSWLHRDGKSAVSIVKPLPRPYWTVEKALDDAELIIEDALSKPASNLR